MKVNDCKYADHDFDWYYYEPICGHHNSAYGGSMCIHHVTPCPYYEERDTLDEIVETLDCIPKRQTKSR